MRTRFSFLLLLSLLLSAAACEKPTEADCQKAIDNINRIHGQPADVKESAPMVRKCRSSSKQAAVQCTIAAKTKEDLAACEGKKP